MKMLPEVVVEIRGRVGCFTLNRPQALNALNLDSFRWTRPSRLLAARLGSRDDVAGGHGRRHGYQPGRIAPHGDRARWANGWP